ncbi:hypothetical protein QVD17_19300 [Tagetes erecta]|uniref:Polygalacturonase n=1 Tax=Tagetes erecta TaxID=13708 RepID=A0AAD8KJ77_TARER|nr:hypothetical protein QVD17_19300 [Tagetes erecta]
MDKSSCIRRTVCCLFVTALIAINHAIVVDIKSKGATGDGKTDDGPALLNAWKEACEGASPSSVLIPPGTYMALSVVLSGPCKGPIKLQATGATIKAPPELAKFKTDSWIRIQNVSKFTMTGGTFDGQGQQTWSSTKCHNSQMTCEIPVNLRLSHVKDSLFKDVTSSNSKNFHIALWRCDNSIFDNLTINAPGNSVNTDGIHIARLNGRAQHNKLKYKDSIGSLGKYPNEEPIQGIWIKNCTITGTTNGVRIKSWPGSYPGMASDIHFEDIIMKKVGNPIMIDQEYCPHDVCKKGTSSKVKLSSVTFRKIRGTSTTKVALNLACSEEAPCDNVEVSDIRLTFHGPGGGSTNSKCLNAKPKVTGENVPQRFV